MKKSKILVLVLIVSLLVGVVFAVASSAFVYHSTAGGDKTAETSWISAPEKTLVKCQGGDCDHTGCDYVYSFAIVGDTQNLNYIDAQNYTAAKAENSALTYADFTSAHMRTLYNWILNNKDSKNIQYVLGLGDITQSFNSSQTYYDEEWPLAKEALSLLDGALGYSLVRGNHDISSGLNAQFGVGTTYYNTLMALAATNDAEGRPMAAFRDANKIEDSYRKIVTTNGDKYIIYTLEYYPTEETIAWLNETLAANSDYDAIITLHAFLNRDATFVNDFETTTPAEDAVNNNWKETATGGNVDPKDLWARSLSKHANVKFIFSGHVGVEDVIVNQLKGDNGNTVTCMLIDCQNIDSSVEPVGVVTMLYVNVDGTVVNVEHISTVRAAAGKAAYLKAQNQFKLDVDYGTAWTETKYGSLPTAEYEANIFHVFLDDDSMADSTNFYFGGFNNWNDTLTAIHTWNGIGGVGARAMKTYNILMSKDYTFSNGIPSNKSGSNPGKFNLDLGNNTLTLSSNGVLVPFYNSRTDGAPTFTVQNGNVVMSGTAKISVLQTSIASAGSHITLDLKDLSVSYNNSNTELVGMYGGTPGAKATVDLNVINCNIDTTGASGAVTLLALKDTNNNNDVDLRIEGGSIVGTTSANLNIYSLNTGDDTAAFVKDASGNYTTVTLNENASPVGVFRDENGKLLDFVTKSTEAPYVFTTEIAPIEETPHGDIPTDVYPVSSYPFVLFQNGEIAGAFATWYDFCQNIWSFDTSEASKTVLYLRDDITISKTSNQLRNVKNIKIDLGGNVLTAATLLFNLFSERDYDFTTNITIENGTITAAEAWSPIIGYNSANTKDVVCKFNLTFNGVTINAASNFQGRLIAEAWSDGTYGSKNVLNLNDCTIDTTVGAISGLFQLNEKSNKQGVAQNKIDVDVTVNGGKLIANSYFTLATFSNERESGKGSPDSLTLSSDFVLQMPNTVAQPTAGIVTTAGTLYPMETEDDGTRSTYYFESLKTKYGTIDTRYLSKVDYPFVLFDGNKNFIAAYSHWSSYVNGHRSGMLLMRRDYDTTESGGNATGLYQIENLVLDLDGHVLSQSTGTANRLIFHAQRSVNTAFTANITVNNGTITMGRNYASVVVFESSKSATDDSVDCKFNFTFNGVTFDTMDGYKGRPILEAWTGNADARGRTKNTVVFNDCTFDATNTNVTILFRLLEGDNTSKVAKNYHDVAVTVNGGKIIKGSQNLTLWNVTPDNMGGGDSLKFGQFNGNYASFVSPVGSAAPTYACESVNGAKLEFANVSTDKNAIYQLGESIITPTGLVIPFGYTDATKYPVLIFKNGSVVATESLMSAAYTKAHAQVQESATDIVTIYLQADMTEKLTTSFSNTEKIKGTLVIDLGGNTYTTSGTALFQINSKDVSNTPKIEIRNGRLNTVRLFALANQTTARCQHYDITFKNVTLGLTQSHWNDMISTNVTAKSAGYYSYVNITFEDCIFDLVTNQGRTSYRLMDLANDDDNHAINVVFKGGEIIYGNVDLTLASIKSGYSDNTHFVTGASDSDTVKFEKGANGYTVFKGASAPTNVYDSTELAFVKTADDGTYATYTLKLAALVDFDFTPKTSITLSNALVYNVYVPVNAALKSFTLGGVEYTDIAALENVVTLSDGKQYYLFEIELPSAEAAKTIALNVVVTVDGKDYKGSFTMSIPKYAAKVIEEGTEVEKTLAKDVLAYVKSAYNYFADYNTAEEIARVNALIDSILGTYTAAPTVSGVTAKDNAGIVTDVTLNLDWKPTIRFYVTDTTVSFYLDGKKLNTVSGVDEKYGAYVELDVYAYALAETITFGDGGSYHISDFVNGSVGTSHEALVNAFAKYVESAADYRSAVIGGNK